MPRLVWASLASYRVRYQYPNPMVQNLPAKIGKYEVLEVLGEGGMGKVYKGVDPLIGRLVAIKVIVAAYIDNPELLKRFYREAKAVGNLQHPNIVTVYDLGEENKNPYLVMQYLDGEPLNKLIAARRELPLLQKLRIVAQVCDALAYAHQRDIVHRDVKPANVILLKDGQVKLLDFGIARLGTSGNSLTETKKGQVMGTMSYIAPEILNEEIADGRSDVYSTGVMLYELLTYRLPFESTELGSLIAKKMQGGPPPSLSKYLENYPPELDEIVSRAMARDREERYSTAQDFAFDLERLMERLKRDLVSHYVERARACISSAELGQAKEILSEVLKIDTQHTAAKQLLYEVQQSLQQQQRNERIRQLRQQAEEAMALKQFDDASKWVDQAIKLDRTDPELLNLREHIQEVKQRGQQVKKLLHLAEVAQQTGELGVFQRALEDALELDPEDPQARVLQASLIRLQAEQEKDAKVQELLGTARREIAARKFDAALEYIHEAEQLDPHRNDIPALKQMVLAGQEQETRKRQLQQLCSAIQQELEANNLSVARDLADKALRAFPGEPALVRMKSAADSQLEAEERRRFIEARIAAASKLLDAGEVSRALSLIQEASRQFPTDTRLRDFLQIVRQAAQKHATQREQAEMLAPARDAMREKRFADAIEILEAAQIKYPDLRDVGDLLALARKEQDLLVQKSMAADVSDQARALVEQQAFGDALSLLEKTVVDNADPALRRFLQNVRAQAAEFEASLDALKQEVMALLDAGYSAEALIKLQSQADKFGQTPKFREFLQRVEEQVAEEQESRQQMTRVLDEAKLYLRQGALREAEAALAECRAKAPRDAAVVALSSQLIEAKAALEREPKVQPPYVLEVSPPPEPKVSAAAATVMFNPGAAVADLTPPAGTTVGSANAGATAAHLATPPIPAEAEEKDVATRLFTMPVEAPAPPSVSTGDDRAVSRVRQPIIEVAPLGTPPEVSSRTKPPKGRLLAVGVLIALSAIAAGVYWRVTHASRIELASLQIQTSPAGATVHAGTVACIAPCTIKLKPGKYEITADLNGFVSATKSIDLQGNQSESLVLAAVSEPTAPVATPAPSPLNNETPTAGKTAAATPAGPEVPAAPVGKGTLEVHAGVEGAAVVIDDHRVGLTSKTGPYRTQIDVGQHNVRLQKEKYQTPKPQTVTIAKNRTTITTFDLKPTTTQPSTVASSPSPTPNNPPTPPPPLPATLILHVPAGASVRLDGQNAVQARSASPLELPIVAGDHSIEVKMDGYKPWSEHQSFAAGSRVELTPDLAKLPVPLPATTATAPPVSSPTPTPPETVPKVTNDRGIHDLLDEYVAAYQDKNRLRLRRIWPGMTDKTFGRLTDALKAADSIHVSLDNCQAPVADGTFTHVACHQTINVKSQGRTISLTSNPIFVLEKLNGDWIIDNIR